MTLRRVVVGERFFLILDSLLPATRAGDRPSRNDFERHELVEIVDHIARGWDVGLFLPNPHDDRIRTYVHRGRLVAIYAVTARELSDGTIELLSIAIDFEGLLDPEEDG